MPNLPRPLRALLLSEPDAANTLYKHFLDHAAELSIVDTVRDACRELSTTAYDLFLVPVTLDEIDPRLLIDMIANLVPDIRKRILVVGRGRTEVLSLIASSCFASGFVALDAPAASQWAIIERVALRNGAHDRTSPPVTAKRKPARPNSAHSLLRGVSMVGGLGRRSGGPESRRAPRPVSVFGHRPGA